jgi:hypothetical protein
MKDYRIIKPDPTLRENLMAFGFMCEKGWYPLIYDTLDKIEEIVVRDELDIQVTEIKEKFGGLRIYLDGYTDEIDKIVQDAEEQSFHICEICGEPGKLREVNRWLMTRCDRCANLKTGNLN